MTDIIAEQDFNALSDSDSFTSDSLPSLSTLTNAGSQNIGGPGLGFITIWIDTRGIGTGPVDSNESGDFIGVSSFTGPDAPDVAADGTPVASGTEHNFQFNDGDGQLDLLFDPVDLTGFENRQLSVDYWIADTGFENTDRFTIALIDTFTVLPVLELGEAELEAQGTGDNGDAGEWQTLTIDLDALLGESEELDPSALRLLVSADTNSGSENIFIDNVAFTGEAAVPQTPLISEFEPNPDGLDPDFQLVELSGTPGEEFNGFLSFIEADNDSEEIQNVNEVSGTFDDNGLLVFAVEDPENPGFTMVLSSELNDDLPGANSDLPAANDVDVDGDGAVDDVAGLFGTVFDAIGVPDTEGDRVFGASLGGVDLTVRGDPELLFREGSTGQIFTVQDTLTPSAEALDEDGNAVALSDFSFLPTPDSFDTVNPVLDDDGAPVGFLVIDDVTVTEGGDAVFTVTLTTQNGDIDPFIATLTTLDNEATGGADFVSQTVSLGFNGIDGETQIFSVSTLDDDAVEADETFAAFIQDAGSAQVTVTDDTGTGTILDNDEAPVTGQFIESFEEEPGTTYLLSDPFEDGFDFFGRFPAPDDSSPVREDFQTGFDGEFAIFGQDHDGGEGAATRTITIPNIDISTLDLPSLTVSLGALDSAPAFLNYEADDGDGIQIFATIDGGARTLIAEFAPPEGGDGDLSLDTDGDGIGDGIIGLGTDLEAFSFALNQTGESLTIEIDLTSTDSFEPLVVDTVIIDEGAVVINEVIYRHTGADDTEFVELFGTPNQSLEGLSLIQVDLSGNIIFQQDFGADDALGANGFFLLGGPEFESFGATPDILLEVDALATFGDNGAIDGESATFALIETDTLGATVSGTETTVDVVAFTDPSNVASTFPFDAPVVGPDGTFPPAGGSRVEDGVDTDSAADWQLRSFFLGDITPTSSTSGAAGGVATDATIPEIQGAGRSSDFAGQLVRTTGIVTAVDSNGFYLQDPDGDGDDATSDGIFVFTSSAPAVSVGDEAQVTGPVLEFGQGIGETQISLPTDVSVLSSGNALPAATVIGDGGRVQPTDTIENGIDFYESLEGMLVTVNAPVAVSPTDGGEIYVLADLGANSPSLSDRGTNNNGLDDFNPEKILITRDAGLLPGETLPSVNVGTEFNTITGVLNYSGSEYEVLPTAAVTVATASDLAPEVTTLTSGDDELTIATYNVLNLDPGDGAARFDALGAQIADNLGSPDIIALQEVQDNSGATDDGTVSASETLQLLADAIAAAGGPDYEVIDNTFITNNLSGGQPGGNIRTAFLYNPERVDLVEDSVRPVGDQEPGSPFNGARLPLAADFEFNGETVTVVNNHFSSKGGSVALFGDTQPTDTADAQEDPSINGSLDERREQAQGVNDFVDAILAEDADANVVVLGDLNEFEFISPVETILTGEEISLAGGFELGEGGTPILTNLTDTLPENEQYTFIFEGTSQSLDHILVSDSLADIAEVDIVHVNVEFVEETSDHEPIITRLDFSEEPDVFTLEILHIADQEAGRTAIEDIPNASAVFNALEAEGAADGTLRLSSGDAIIPGLFFEASAEAFGGAGRADILVQNELGFEAITLGNHEFDLGTEFLADLILPDAEDGYDGALFPYLSANLDFSTDPNLDPLVVEGGNAPEANSITTSVVSEVEGEQIGIIGLTTPNLVEITSPDGVTVLPEDFFASDFDDDESFNDDQLAALAEIAQDEIDALTEQGIDKIILMSHLQNLTNEIELIPLLSDVDIVIGGGSNALLADDEDITRGLRDGDDADDVDGDYPFTDDGGFLTDADGNPVALVNTDGNYSYVGRLVIEFDEDGVIIPESYDPTVSGAYATDAAGVAALEAEDLIDPEIQAIIDTLAIEVEALEQTVIGFTDVFIAGSDRNPGVRTEETNAGNLTADANLAEAKKVDPTVLVSIKNGGGIRQDIGDGTTDTPPEDGEITIADHFNVLSFNNSLVLQTLTGAQLAAVLEAALGQVGGGGFPQVSGLEVSFDETLPAGARIQSLEVLGEDGDPVATIVADGALVSPDFEVRIVTLNFLAGGGNGYPLADFADDDPDFADVVELNSGQSVRTGAATFADDGTEQDALAEFLIENHGTPEEAFNEADVPPAEDTRIQNLGAREDTVLDDGVFVIGNDDGNRLVGPDGGAVFDGRGGRDVYIGSEASDIFLLADGEREQIRNLDTADIFDVSPWGIQSFEELLFVEREGLIGIHDKVTNNAVFAFSDDDSNPAIEELTEDNFLFAAVQDLTVEAGAADGVLDRLSGRAGNDEIIAGEDFAIMTGFDGSDTFVLADRRGSIVTDFEAEDDVLDVSAWGIESLDGLRIGENADAVFVSEADDPAGSLIRLEKAATGLTAADLDEDNFTFADPLLLT